MVFHNNVRSNITNCIFFNFNYFVFSKLIILKLLHLIETHSKHDLTKERYVLNDLFFSFPFEYFGDLIQFQLTGDAVLVAANPLKPVYADSTEQFALPDIYPIKPTVTLTPQNFYDLDSIYRKWLLNLFSYCK